MPRFSGVSLTSMLWCRRRRPSPLAHCACPGVRPKRLFKSVSRIVLLPFATSVSSAEELFGGLAALSRDLRGRAHLRESIHRRAHDVDRVARAVALREHVTH